MFYLPRPCRGQGPADVAHVHGCLSSQRNAAMYGQTIQSNARPTRATMTRSVPL